MVGKSTPRARGLQGDRQRKVTQRASRRLARLDALRVALERVEGAAELGDLLAGGTPLGVRVAPDARAPAQEVLDLALVAVGPGGVAQQRREALVLAQALDR